MKKNSQGPIKREGIHTHLLDEFVENPVIFQRGKVKAVLIRASFSDREGSPVKDDVPKVGIFDSIMQNR